MAYSAGDTILDDEYNTFVNSSSDPFGYNHFAGTGSSQYGLGQTAIALQTAGTTIQASQWNTLFTGMSNINRSPPKAVILTGKQGGVHQSMRSI